MIFGKGLKILERFAIDNSATILTVIGATGVLTTAALTGRATLKATELINDKNFVQKQHGAPELTRNEKIYLVWKCYIPAAGAAVLSVGAVIGANHINNRRMAALALAYSLQDKRFEDYKNKAAEKLGVKKESAMRDELAQDRLNENPPDKNVVFVGTGDVLCFDQFTGRYFKGTMEKLRKAENDTNYDIVRVGFACLSDFYERLGLKPTSMSEQFGWRKDKVDLHVTSVLTDDGTPCISFDFDVKPMQNYDLCLNDE